MITTQRSSTDSSLTVEVVETVVRHDGIDLLEVEPSLSSVIDTDALDQLFTVTNGKQRNDHVTFSFQGDTVSVSEREGVSVEPIDSPPDDLQG